MTACHELDLPPRAACPGWERGTDTDQIVLLGKGWEHGTAVERDTGGGGASSDGAVVERDNGGGWRK